MTHNDQSQQNQYQPGDIVNDHQLTPEGQWVPVGTQTTTVPGPAPQVPAEPKKGMSTTKKVLIGAGAALAAVVVFGALAGSGADDTDSGASGDGTVATQEAAAGIGDTVSDGNFDFTVDEVESLGTSVGDDIFGETAQGEYVGVTVTVTNTGDEPQSWFDDNQTLIIDGKEYAADSMATLTVNSEGFYEEINPGNSMTITLVYDVPAGSAPSAIELHDSAFSGGVTVQL